jgi:hypothetical protein
VAFWFGHTATSVELGRTHDVESMAFTLLETARLRCELVALRDSVEEAELREVHRDLGLAGYYACAEFGREQRLECLALAHGECDNHPLLDLRTAIETIFDEAAAAADALADALTELELPSRGELSDVQRHLAHVHAAHLHVMSAAETLDALLIDLQQRPG